MKFNTENLIYDESLILSIENKDLSYSPMYSNIGLVTSNDYCGIEALYLHYNRTSRAIWSPFIIFEDGFSRIPSSVCCISFQKGNKKATIAFYEKDRFVVEAENTESFSICTETADTSEEMWVESRTGDCLVLRGYSVNRDARDPDRIVPYMAGVKALKGNLVEEDRRIKVMADKEGKILAAFALETLEISKARILKRLEEAPISAAIAEKNTGEWFCKCLNGFTVDLGSEKEKNIMAHAVTGLLFNETMGPGNLKGYVSAYPSRGTYPSHYLWDTCFQNLALEEMSPCLAKDGLLLFAKCQRADGKYEQFLCSTWSRPHEAQPALIGWAVKRIVEKEGVKDREFAERMYRSLELNNNWWLQQRMTRYGIIYCPHGLETGQDDSPRFDQGPILAVDMNSYLLSQMRETAWLARILGFEDEAAEWNIRANILEENMIKVLYDSQLNMFFDADPKTGKKRSLRSASGFLPLWAGISIEKDRAIDMINTHMLDEKCFFGKIPFPCIAYDQDVYQPEKWWRGPTWMSLAWLMLEILCKYGFRNEYEKACRIYYKMLIKDGQLRELFNSQTGEGLGAYDQGWTAAIFIKLNKILHER